MSEKLNAESSQDMLKNTQLKHVVGGLVAKNAGLVAAPAAVYGAVSTFGVASTGTAISSLSGAAATSATLAAIGGSVVTGTVVLAGVGIVGAMISRRLYMRWINRKSEE